MLFGYKLFPTEEVAANEEKNEQQKHLGEFQLLKTIGTGTFGRVYLSKDAKTSTFYAMKVLKKSEIVRLRQVEHINNEKQILKEISFPFIVDLICTFQDEKSLFMLEEYVVGGEIFSHLRRAGKIEMVMIPIHFREIITSSGHDTAVDWWALGILAYEMLMGYPPFSDEEVFGIYEKILGGKISFSSTLEPLAKDFIKRLLTSDRTRRLGNLKEGSADVKAHQWFKGVDWKALLRKEVIAPIIPIFSHPGDTVSKAIVLILDVGC
ncbi:hypothetical protein HK099_001738 [Clydaea vesicula]|uniref:cAMP-dependent protein kinase n=1 Tax=Clydaea vesicula TaxID=447962 RepID=A0AAD5XZK9_9FUNG|nr:hypothetical protein HK099_001738 [Clydaea vesicula]